MAETLRVGILGAGYIAPYHLRALRRVPEARAVAVCDLAAERARTLAADFGVPGVHRDLGEMLARERLDVLHVLLPPQRHAPAVEEAVAAGVHVLVEKPLAADGDEAARLAEQAKSAGVQLGTSHNFLFSPAYERFRDWLRDGTLGRLDELEIVWQKPLELAALARLGAFVARDPGNVALEIAPHAFAHLHDLCGEPGEGTLETDRPYFLPDGRPFHRRFVRTHRVGPARVTLRFGFGPGYTTHLLRARGSFASAEVDFERDHATLRRHRPYGLDVDRLAASTREGAGQILGAGRTFADVVLGKAGARRGGAPFDASIARSVAGFYDGVRAGSLDPRHATAFSIAVVRTAHAVARELREAAPAARPLPPAAPAPEAPDHLVLGASGFIGQALVRRLVEDGRRVRVLVRRRASLPPELTALGLDVVEGDLRDDARVVAALDGIDRVFHLARGYGERWEDVLADDVEPTGRLAERCLEAGVRRLVYASSVVIYDAGDPRRTIDESTPPGPGMLRSMTYARGKAECERRLLALHRERALPVVIVRPGIVVGRGASPMHFGIGNWPFPGLCDVWGAGRTPLPLVLVDDVADGLVRCAAVEGIAGESFNLVGPPLLTAREYLDELERCTGTRIRRRYVAPARTHAVDWLKWAAKSALGLPARARPTLALARARTMASPFDARRARDRLGWSPCAERQALVREGIAGPAEDWLG